MGLRKAWKYIINNCVSEDLKSMINISKIDFENTPDNISYDVEGLIEEVKEDIEEYGEKEIAWVYFKPIGGYLVPYDYLLEAHDELDEDDLHFEVTLKELLEVYRLLDEI